MQGRGGTPVGLHEQHAHGLQAAQDLGRAPDGDDVREGVGAGGGHRVHRGAVAQAGQHLLVAAPQDALLLVQRLLQHPGTRSGNQSGMSVVTLVWSWLHGKY